MTVWSWNNNLAARTRFKRISLLPGSVDERQRSRLTEHLVLLSIYQTCRGQSLSFPEIPVVADAMLLPRSEQTPAAKQLAH